MRHRPGLTGLRPTTGCDSYEPPGTGACLDDGRIGRSVKRAAALRSAGPNGARGVDDRPLADRPTFLDYHGAPDKASFAAWIAPSFDPATPSRFAAREARRPHTLQRAASTSFRRVPRAPTSPAPGTRAVPRTAARNARAGALRLHTVAGAPAPVRPPDRRPPKRRSRDRAAAAPSGTP